MAEGEGNDRKVDTAMAEGEGNDDTMPTRGGREDTAIAEGEGNDGTMSTRGGGGGKDDTAMAESDGNDRTSSTRGGNDDTAMAGGEGNDHEVQLVDDRTLIPVAEANQGAIRSDRRTAWRVPRSSPTLDQLLLSAQTEKEFTSIFRVRRSTFDYICSLLAPIMHKSKRGGGISLEKRVGVSLHRLGTGNYLLGCADLFGMSEASASIAVRQFCRAVLQIIRPLVVPRFTKEALPQIAKQFEAKHEIPFIMGAVGVSHIPIIAPPRDPIPFFNREGFSSTLLQGIVDTETTFWDWDFGWAGSLTDYSLLMATREGINVVDGKYHPYKLIGGVDYPCRFNMFVPFKGSKEQLEPYQVYWNFIHGSTSMCVGRAFAVLKGRWRILLRRIEMKLDHVADVVGASICLHNLCILHKDFGDVSLAEEARQWLDLQQTNKFGDVKRTETMKIIDYGKAEISRMNVNEVEVIHDVRLSTDEERFFDIHLADKSDVQALKRGVTMHTGLAKSLYKCHLREQGQLADGDSDEVSESSDDLDSEDSESSAELDSEDSELSSGLDQLY